MSISSSDKLDGNIVRGTFIFDLFLPVNELIKESDGEDFSEAAKTKFEIKLFASKNFIMHSTLSPFMINFLGFCQLQLAN